MSWVAPAAQGLQLVTGKKGQQSAQKQANALTGEQSGIIKAAYPAVEAGLTNALQYDPVQEDQSALQANDIAQQESIDRDYGNPEVQQATRGFGQGTASTDKAGFAQAVGAGRAGARATLAAGLAASDKSRRASMLSSAVQPALQLSGALQGPATNAWNRASSYDFSGPLNGLSNDNWNWLKARRSSTQQNNDISIPGSSQNSDGTYSPPQG